MRKNLLVNKATFLNIIALNLSLLIIGVVVLELFFGGWFVATNKLDLLGIPRNQHLSIEHEYYPNTGKTSYTRDQYGIRGLSVLNQPEKIDILTIGGSTTDQLYIDDSQTWQQHLQRLLHANSKPLNIGNAGINGQSTHGHIKSFEHWFPQLKQLINDYYTPSPNGFDLNLETRLIEDSALYSIFRKVKGMLIGVKSNLTHNKVSFSDYSYNATKRQVAHKEVINGVDYHYHLNLLNEVVRDVSQNHYLTIELTNLDIWNENDFYDWIHMTPNGTEKAARLMFDQLKDQL